MATYDLFTKLPDEITLAIIEDVDEDDLLPLRLTCRHLNVFATEAFGNRVFRTRFYMLVPFSLQRLSEIATHPIFGRFVKHIWISGFAFAAGEGYGYRYEDHYLTFLDEQLNFVESGEAAKVVQDIFSALQAFGPIDIGVLVEEGGINDCSAWGIDEMLSPFIVWDYSSHSVIIFQLLVAAAARSHCLIDRVSLESPYGDYDLNEYLPDELPAGKRRPPQCRQLEMTWIYYDERDRTTFSNMISVISMDNPALETLHLHIENRMNYNNDTDMYLWLLGLSSKVLKTIKFKCLRWYGDVLIAFLENHRDTLRNVTLSFYPLVDPETSRREERMVDEWIDENLVLKHKNITFSS